MSNSATQCRWMLKNIKQTFLSATSHPILLAAATFKQWLITSTSVLEGDSKSYRLTLDRARNHFWSIPEVCCPCCFFYTQQAVHDQITWSVLLVTWGGVSKFVSWFRTVTCWSHFFIMNCLNLMRSSSWLMSLFTFFRITSITNWAPFFFFFLNSQIMNPHLPLTL